MSASFSQSSMNTAYNQMLNNQSFLYPQQQPGIGGWAVVNDAEANRDDDRDPETARTGEDYEDEGGGFFSMLATFIFMMVVLFAPIIAACWLAAP